MPTFVAICLHFYLYSCASVSRNLYQYTKAAAKGAVPTYRHDTKIYVGSSFYLSVSYYLAQARRWEYIPVGFSSYIICLFHEFLIKKSYTISLKGSQYKQTKVFLNNC